jgi:hypothetical protein
MNTIEEILAAKIGPHFELTIFKVRDIIPTNINKCKYFVSIQESSQHDEPGTVRKGRENLSPSWGCAANE